MGRLRIVIEEKSSGKELCPIEVGQGSSFGCDILGVSPCIDDLQVHLGKINAKGFYPVRASLSGDGVWRLYTNGFVFPVVGDSKYHITGRDMEGNSRWLGSGRLRVFASTLHVIDEDLTIVPEDTYLRNPDTGLWHRLYVRMEDGLLVPEIDEEGVVR